MRISEVRFFPYKWVYISTFSFAPRRGKDVEGSIQTPAEMKAFTIANTTFFFFRDPVFFFLSSHSSDFVLTGEKQFQVLDNHSREVVGSLPRRLHRIRGEDGRRRLGRR